MEEENVLNVTPEMQEDQRRKKFDRAKTVKYIGMAIEISCLALMAVEMAPVMVPVTVYRGYKLWRVLRWLRPIKRVAYILRRIFRRGL